MNGYRDNKNMKGTIMTNSGLLELLMEYSRNELRELTVTREKINNFDFSGYDLGGSFFMEDEFSSCIFDSTNLEITNFGGSIFNDCKLNGNRIIDAYWHDVSMINTTIQNIEATRNFAFNMKINNCEVKDSVFLSCCFTNFSDGIVTGTIFRNCSFEKCDFQNCVFRSVKFVECVFIDTEIETEGNDVSFIDCQR